jgi:competence protein ComEA
MKFFRSLPGALLTIAAVLATGATPAWSAPVNINAADASTLAQDLKGIGPVKAQAIVEYRQKHGAFHSVDELAQVKGISQKLIDRNRADLRIGQAGPAPAATTAARPTAKPAHP